MTYIEEPTICMDFKYNRDISKLKLCIYIFPILIHDDPSMSFIFEADTFDFSPTSALSQTKDDGWLCLVVFHLAKFQVMKTNRLITKSYWSS